MYGPVLSHLPVTDRRVWLTIDDGPSDDTPALPDLLEAHGAKATFFLVGERAAAPPDLVRGLAARGHGTRHQSHGHPPPRFWASGPARIRRARMQSREVPRAVTGTKEQRGRGNRETRPEK